MKNLNKTKVGIILGFGRTNEFRLQGLIGRLDTDARLVKIITLGNLPGDFHLPGVFVQNLGTWLKGLIYGQEFRLLSLKRSYEQQE
jgi:hypothetical protein